MIESQKGDRSRPQVQPPRMHREFTLTSHLDFFLYFHFLIPLVLIIINIIVICRHHLIVINLPPSTFIIIKLGSVLVSFTVGVLSVQDSNELPVIMLITRARSIARLC